MISNLEEGSEKLEGELRKWLFQGQMSEARDLRPSSDKACHPRARQRCCRLGGSWARCQHQPRDVHWGQRYLVMPSSQVSTRSQPAWEMLYERVTLKLCQGHTGSFSSNTCLPGEALGDLQRGVMEGAEWPLLQNVSEPSLFSRGAYWNLLICMSLLPRWKLTESTGRYIKAQMTGNAKQNLAKRSTSENSDIFQNTHQSHHSDRENHINQSEIFIKTCYTQANEYNQKAKNSSRDITEKMDFFF